jgi:hypothetical protein
MRRRMALRTLLFLLTNLLVVLTISLILGALASVGLLPADLPWLPLLVGCFGWGVLGSWIALQFSARSAAGEPGGEAGGTGWPAHAGRGDLRLAGVECLCHGPLPATRVSGGVERPS